MVKVIEINPEVCTGCRYCENICSFKHTYECAPTRARINVIKFEKRGLFVPMLCEQCEEPPCMDVCPTGALHIDPSTKILRIKDAICIGCKVCMIACPFGVIKIDRITKKAIKCDLCEGDPLCVKYCVTGALKYVEETHAYSMKRLEKASKMTTHIE
jgi:Fe-S-cluster-containing hydrogenase component 2